MVSINDLCCPPPLYKSLGSGLSVGRSFNLALFLVLSILVTIIQNGCNDLVLKHKQQNSTDT